MDIESALFITLVRSEKDQQQVKLLIESIRGFGGLLGLSPICCFESKPLLNTQARLKDLHVQVLPLILPESVHHYLFADKVYACAQVEAMIAPKVQSLIWIDPAYFVIKPPVLYDLGYNADAALRPVHIQNVGLLKDDPLNGYWGKIFSIVGIEDITTSVETFVDEKQIRSYFNSHAFSVNPTMGILQKWFDDFEILVTDKDFQENCCSDPLYQVFLHQAVFSAVIASQIHPNRLRILPSVYNYPYNLHLEIPLKKRAECLNDLISITLENRSLNPDDVDDIHINDPLNSWLKEKNQIDMG